MEEDHRGTFADNLLKKSSQFKNKVTKVMVDGNDAIYWTTKSKDTTATTEFKLAAGTSFDVRILQENIRIGQRIEKFVLEYQVDTGWEKAVEDTTVGYKRLLKFPAVNTGAVRLRIESSRLNPTIAKMGLYKEVR